MIKEDGESGAPRQWATGLSGELDGAAGELARLVLEAPGLELERLELSAGETLFRQGEAGGYLHVVLSGRLGVRQADDDGESMEVGEVGPGEVAGEIQLLTGGRRTATVTALTDVVLARCSQPALDRLAAATPEAARRLLDTIRRRLRRNQLAAVLRRRFGRLDRESLDFIESLGRWRRLRGGEVLFEQGEAARSFFLLVAGRLEAVIHGFGGDHVAGEVVQGESVGEMGVLTSHPRSAMVRALRDSELVEFSREAFERMVCRHPEIVRVMAEVLTDRLARSNVSRTAGARVVNVALVPAGAQQAQANAAVDRLAPMLAEALSRHGAVLLLTSDRVEQLLGMAVAQTTHDSPFDIRLSAWLHEMGRQHRFVILQADPGHTPWTRRCVMFADRVLLAGAAGSDPGLSAEERDLGDAWRRSPAPSRMLVLLHDRPGEFAERTRDWLAPRDDVRHAHLRLDV
ncbi:MAG: cyclic nucleotide-binding domain-containing protein, partial [Desulfovibrionaceae bacterium]